VVKIVRFSRCRSLFGEEKFESFKDISILILGVGGVGSYALDCLYRSGFSEITIVDYDIYDESNQNRQIGSEAIGDLKTKRLKELYPKINVMNQKMDLEWVEGFDFDSFDIVLDCADTTAVKIAVAKKCYKKLIMSVGSAKRYDAGKIEVASIWKTHGDALARKIRNQLKKDKFNRNFMVVFSSEEDRCKDKGSFVGVTGSFGLRVCSEVVKKVMALR
jgi:tRNA A37 threonylcarbamoyladenosine dehydratase